MTARTAPDAATPLVDRAAFDAALAEQVAAEKEVTRHADRVSAARRRLPMVEVEDYEFTGRGGPVRLTELFGDHYLLLLQNVMYGADWGWNVTGGDWTGPQPGYSYYLLRDGRPYLTYLTRARGTEAILPLAHIMDRTVYGRQQDWEDSPEGWPQEPTYG